MDITPESLHFVPAVEVLRRAFQSAAIFEAAIEDNPNMRVFAFRREWIRGASFGWVDNGQGDCIRGAFFDRDAILGGYNKGSPLSEYPADKIDRETLGETSEVPEFLRSFLTTKDFDCGGSTFCIWRTSSDDQWSAARVLYCSAEVSAYPLEYLELLTGDAAPFIAWAEEDEKRAGLGNLIVRLFRHEPLSRKIMRELKSRRSYASVVEEAIKIGYPVGP